MRKLQRRLPLGIAAAIVLTVGLAACGSSSKKSSSSSTSSSASSTPSSSATSTSTGSSTTSNTAFEPTGSGGLKLVGSAGPQNGQATNPLGTKAQTGTPAAKSAIAAATTDAAAIGAAKIPPGTTVGLEEIINSVPSAQRADGQLEYALRELGINVIPCDAEGDPTKMSTCVTSLVNQNVKAIISLGTDPGLIAAGLAAAKAKKIPVITFSGQVGPSPDWYRAFYNDDSYAGTILGQYVTKQLASKSSPTVWISNYPASWATARTQGLTSAIKGTNVKVAATTTVSSTDPIAGTQQQVVTQYTQDPNTSAYWFAYDAPGAAGAQALASKTGGKPFPTGPLVVTFHDDQQANQLLRDGQLSAVVDENYDASSFEAADAVAQYLAGKPVPASDTTIHTPFAGKYQMYSYPVITKANNPPAGKWPAPHFDSISYFTQLWMKEFGLQPATS
jgi:ABC-type sugar transport system substrate-binding protein